MDFDLTALRACFIPIMELERKFVHSCFRSCANLSVGAFRVATMNTLALELTRMVLFT
jgi:hypothetical protein